jgi:hypothetical protein
MFKNDQYTLASKRLIPFIESFLGNCLSSVYCSLRIPRRISELLDLKELNSMLPPEMVCHSIDLRRICTDS